MRAMTSHTSGWLAAALVALAAASGAAPAEAQDRAVSERVARIDGGPFAPFFADPETESTEVAPFLLDREPVTNEAYAAFVDQAPAWAPGAPPAIFASAGYLSRWAGRSPVEVASDPALRDQPVTGVSFFAAQAYCAHVGGRLPTEAEWELVAQASATERDASDDPAHVRRVLSWYERPSQGLGDVGQGEPNAWGVSDMHGLVWEWVADFNASMVGGARRGASARLLGFFCGGAAVEARSPSDYATFLRYAFRSSLSGDYTSSSLGFRCAFDLENPS
jgi:formylglycine-generating enzyme required for sulfatase activity